MKTAEYTQKFKYAYRMTQSVAVISALVLATPRMPIAAVLSVIMAADRAIAVRPVDLRPVLCNSAIMTVSRGDLVVGDSTASAIEGMGRDFRVR